MCIPADSCRDTQMTTMKFTAVILFSFACVLASCSFNHQFLKPDKIPVDKKQAYLRDGRRDTIMVMHFGANHQPTFTSKDGVPADLGYNIESVVFDNNNKTHKLTGWFIKPANAKPDITLLLLHGNAGNILTEYLAAAVLAKKGMQVFVIDYSGYGFSEGKASWQNVWNDAGTALQYLHTRTDVQGTALAIYGQSYGGYTAVAVAQKYQNIITGLVTEGAPTSRKDIGAYQTKLGIIARALIKERHSAIKAIAKFHKPVLIIQSDEDQTVPFKMGEQLYAHANQPKTLYKIHKLHLAGLAYDADSIIYYVRKTVKP